MANPVYPGPMNSFIPEATGQAIAYIRDLKEFAVNRYVQIIKAEQPVVLYHFLDPDEPIRVVTDQEYDWPPGQPRPKPQGNIGNFLINEVRTKRRAYGYSIDEQLVDTQKGWKPQAFFNQIILSKAMTNLTARVSNLIETPGNWGNNTSDAGVLNGLGAGSAGNFVGASDQETSAKFLVIKKTLDNAIININLATNGMVKRHMLRWRINPVLASLISETAEIHHYLGNSVFAMAQVRGDAPGFNKEWQIPDQIYGVEVVIEDAAHTISRPYASGQLATVGTQKVYIGANANSVILSRVGGLDGNYGAPNFSTVQRYYYKYEMAVEARHLAWDKAYESSVVDQFLEVLAAPQAGWLITSCM